MKKNFCISALASIFIAFILFFVYLLLDYFNIPTAIGIEVSRFNMDALGIIVNAVVAVAIFALGYHLVEQWNVKKLANQKLNQHYTVVTSPVYIFPICLKNTATKTILLLLQIIQRCWNSFPCLILVHLMKKLSSSNIFQRVF